MQTPSNLMKLYITGLTLTVIGLHIVTWGHNLAAYTDDEREERNARKSQNPQGAQRLG